MEIYAINLLNKIPDGVFNKLMQYISESKKTKIRKLVNREDQERSLVGELLARYAICLKGQIKNDEIRISADRYGKPFLFNTRKLDFNISHSDKWIVCGIDNVRIGVDIEKIVNSDYCNVAKEFFTKEECDIVLNTTIDRQLENFYRIWTLKESYLKAIGIGMLIPLNSFSVIFDKNICFMISDHNQNNWYFREYHLEAGYKMSICSLTNKFPDYIKTISLQDLIKYFFV